MYIQTDTHGQCPGPDFLKSLVKGSDLELVSINWCMQMNESKSVTSSSFIQKEYHPEGLSLNHHGRGGKKKKRKENVHSTFSFKQASAWPGYLLCIQ